jgi:hypothetical protein
MEEPTPDIFRGGSKTNAVWIEAVWGCRETADGRNCRHPSLDVFHVSRAQQFRSAPELTLEAFFRARTRSLAGLAVSQCRSKKRRGIAHNRCATLAQFIPGGLHKPLEPM